MLTMLLHKFKIIFMPYSAPFFILLFSLSTAAFAAETAPAASPAPAPVKKEKKADSAKIEKVDFTTAFRECLNESVKDSKLALKKEEVDGHNWSIASLECNGDKAMNLYIAAGAENEQYTKYEDGRRGITRFLGNLMPPTQCSRVTAGPKGVEMNLYSCSIRIDLNHDLVRELKL